MSLEENLKTVINVLAKNITEKKQKDNEELFLELKKIYNEDPNEFMTLMSIANFDLEEILESIIEIPEQKYDFVIKYILNGMYEEFHEKRMEKLEGFSCSADKSSFITQLTLKALKTNRNISLYQDYQNIEQIKENKERQAYWSPRTVKDTIDMVKDIKFDSLGAFTYSREEDTKSYDMDEQIPEELKESRYEELMLVQNSIIKDINSSRIGKVYETLIERYETLFDRYVGRTYTSASEGNGTSVR